MALTCALAAATLAGCGLELNSPDLFVLTRTGQGPKLTMLVNSGGPLHCNGHTHQLPDARLVVARSLPGPMIPDATHKLNPPSPPNSVYRYRVTIQQGTFSFPDTASAHRPELARLEQFVAQVQGMCG